MRLIASAPGHVEALHPIFEEELAFRTAGSSPVQYKVGRLSAASAEDWLGDTFRQIIRLLKGIDAYGRTALHYANDTKEIEELISNGRDINLQDNDGWAPLHFYAKASCFSAMELALKHGANPNLYDHHGNGPLWAATMNARGDFDCVAALLAAGANANHTNNYGRSPLHLAQEIKHGLDGVFEKHPDVRQNPCTQEPPGSIQAAPLRRSK